MIRRRAWPIRTRLTVMASVLMTLVCLTMSVLVIIGVRGRAADYRLSETSSAALRVIHLIKRNQLPHVLSSQAEAIQVLNAAGQVVASTAQLTGKPPIADFRPAENSVRADQLRCPPAGLRGCMIVVSFRVYEPDGDWIVYAADRRVEWYVSPGFVTFLIGLSLLLITVTAVGTSRTVSRTLAPVSAIRAKLAEINATDPGRRVPVPESNDEIRLLAETANATLDRIEAALAQLRQFTSDASHDLRSPITAMRAQVEEALLYPDDTDWPKMATAVLSSLDRLQAIVEDLLTLAQLDHCTERGNDPIDLAQLVTTEIQRRPRSKKILTDLQGQPVVTGDRLRLTRLLTNLIDNAERHATTHITITVRSTPDNAVLEVLDDGTGIPPEHRETIFQRFTRLDAARNRDAGGTGLGLPIARQIAESHGGTLTAEDSPTGARFVLRLPHTA